MESKNFELPQTTQALAELSATAAALAAAFKSKQAELKRRHEDSLTELKAKEEALAGLQTASAAALAGMDDMISQLDKVLENNGTGNHNN